MTYLDGREKYNRPQAMIWADQLVNSNQPGGKEVGQDGGSDFLILSDHNRSDIGFNIDRIEKRERMVNGRMRSWHIADKRKINVSWNMLPSRSFKSYAAFNSSGASTQNTPSDQYTVDGGAGGMELFDWYQEHTYPFYVLLSYDNFDTVSAAADRSNLDKYTEVIEMYITDFRYDVVKRSNLNYDFWNISVTLEEV